MKDRSRTAYSGVPARAGLQIWATLAACVVFAAPATAMAATKQSTAHSVALSAAHAQYGHPAVLTPPQAPKTPTSKNGVSATNPAARPVKTTSTLPFTGLALLKFGLLGLALIAAGFVLRGRGARRTSRS